MRQPRSDVHVALEVWKRDHDHASRSLLQTHYVFSPEWYGIHRQYHASYDDLERRRRESGEPRLPWQDGVEGERKAAEQQRTKFYKPMTSDLWRFCPLAVHMHRYLGRPEPDHHRRAHGWNAILPDWEEFDALIRQDATFRASLSETQASSYKVLKSWLGAEYCDAILPSAAHRYIGHAMKDSTDDPPLVCKRLPAWALEMAMLDKSVYHASVFELFLLEFHPNAWEPCTSSVTLQTLQKARHTGSCRAVLQKLAWSFIADGRPDSQDGYPRVWLNEAQTLDLYGSINDAERPYYLWDTENERTVTVDELLEQPQVLECPQYSKRKDQEIGKQADIFRRSQRCIAWITDAESWDGVVNSLRWLGLKAMKLTSTLVDERVDEMWPMVNAAASSPIELMRESSTKHSHAVLAAMDHRAAPTASPTYEEPVPWFSSLWTLQECFLCPDIQMYTKHWRRLEDSRGDAITLQALMVFIAENDKYFSSKQRVDVPLYDGNAHNNAMWDQASVTNRGWSGPRGVQQLLNLCMLTRLDNILTAGMPTALLTNSNLRQCTSSRAPAIMSALGVTDWHKKRLSDWRHRIYDPMVFGMFPLDFVREAAAKLGGTFFESTSLNRQGSREYPSYKTAILAKDSLGTMLPFTNKQGWFSGVTGSYDHHIVSREDHPAVSTWVICSDGSVNMPHAGISIASDGSLPYERVYGFLHCYFRTSQGPRKVDSIIETDDLHAKLKDVAQDEVVIAVALWESYYYQHGMLLQKLPYSILGRDCYIKVGGYIAKELSMPPSTPVRWKVL